MWLLPWTQPLNLGPSTRKSVVALNRTPTRGLCQCQRVAERPHHSLSMGKKKDKKKAAQLTQDAGAQSHQQPIPSFQGGITHTASEHRTHSTATTGGQRRASHRIQQGVARNVYDDNNINNNNNNNGQSMIHNAGSNANPYQSAPASFYNPYPYVAGNPYVVRNGENSNLIHNTENFGWGPNYYAPPIAIEQMRRTAPAPAPALDPASVMQPQWVQMQIMQQMMLAQHMHMSGRYAANQALFNQVNGMHQHQMRNMSTGGFRSRGLHTAEASGPMTTEPRNNMFEMDNNQSHRAGVSAARNHPSSSSSSRPERGGGGGGPVVEPPVAPLPAAEYLEQANKEPLEIPFIQPLLVILDLNGTLLYRKRKSFPPKFVRRPALDYFLERLTSRHIVMVWSSSRPATVHAICDEIFSQGQQKKLIARWSRDKLGLNPDQYNAKVQVYKELDKVWNDPNIQARFPNNSKHRAGKSAFNTIRYHQPHLDETKEMTGFLAKKWDQSNTLLIDDSVLKASANPYNILQVPEFTNEPNPDDQTVLKELLNKIRLLSRTNDVSRQLRAWGPEGIQLNRDEVLSSSEEGGGYYSSSDESQPDVEKVPSQSAGDMKEKEAEAEAEEAEEIVPIDAGYPDQSVKRAQFKERSHLERAHRAALKKKKKKQKEFEEKRKGLPY